jgi:tetratricopeptide (TPR) repeat protein
VPHIVHERAVNFVQLHEFRDVELLYDRAINAARQQLPASDPIFAQLVYEEGQYYCYKELKWKEGADQMRKSLEISRPSEGWRLADHERSLGFALLDAFQFNESERYCREVLALNPTIDQGQDFWVVAFPTLTLARALAEQQKLPEAERNFRNGLAIMTTPAGSRGVESWMYPQVASAFLHVLRLENKTPDAAAFTTLLASNGVCLYAAAWAIEWGDSLKKYNHPENLADWSNDVAYLARAASPDDSTNLPSYLLSDLLEKGYKKQAANICRRRLANAAATDAQWLASTSFELANAENLASRDPALAVEMAKRAVELSPRDPENIGPLTAALYRAGNFQQSIAEMEKAPQMSQYGEAVADLFLSMAHCQIGQSHTARLLYEQSAQWIAEHDPDSEELTRIRTETESLLNSKTPAAQ